MTNYGDIDHIKGILKTMNESLDVNETPTNIGDIMKRHDFVKIGNYKTRSTLYG